MLYKVSLLSGKLTSGSEKEDVKDRRSMTFTCRSRSRSICLHAANCIFFSFHHHIPPLDGRQAISSLTSSENSTVVTWRVARNGELCLISLPASPSYYLYVASGSSMSPPRSLPASSSPLDSLFWTDFDSGSSNIFAAKLPDAERIFRALEALE